MNARIVWGPAGTFVAVQLILKNGALFPAGRRVTANSRPSFVLTAPMISPGRGENSPASACHATATARPAGWSMRTVVDRPAATVLDVEVSVAMLSSHLGAGYAGGNAGTRGRKCGPRAQICDLERAAERPVGDETSEQAVFRLRREAP